MPSTFWARTDSGTANNPALNLKGDAAVEITFVASGGSGDLFLEQPAGGGVDPDTQISIGGTSYDFTFELSGTLPTRNSDGAQQVPDQLQGSVVYIVTVQDYPAAGDTTRLAFLPEETATQTEMDSFGNGAIDIQGVDETPAPGPVCFAGGTKILTAHGEVLVEELQEGDMVVTLDDGPMPILWISSSRMSWPLESSSSKPIKISAGALGQNLPLRDLVVSPQHKVLLTKDRTFDGLPEQQFLAPAKGLLSWPGVRLMKGKLDVVYYHILLAKHSILFSDGLPSESFYPGPCAQKMLKQHQRAEILALFPELANMHSSGYGPQARRCMTRKETEELAAKRDQRVLLAKAA